MKEEISRTLEQSLIEILDKTVKGIEKGADFLQAELPDVIKQLLFWNGVENFVYFSVAIIALVISILCLKAAIKSTKVEGYEIERSGNPTKEFGITLLYLTSTIISLAVFGCNINIIWLKIWLAPKVWLIEYAASLVK